MLFQRLSVRHQQELKQGRSLVTIDAGLDDDTLTKKTRGTVVPRVN